MIEKYAAHFSLALGALTEMRHRIDVAQREALVGHPVRWDMQSKEMQDLVGVIRHLRSTALLADFDSFAPDIDHLEKLTRTPQHIIPLSHEIGHLQRRLINVLEGEYFFHVNQADVPLYAAKEPFGADVTAKFDVAREDIEEAAKCLALQRPTACVFHLMRVMEAAVQRLRKKFRIAIEDPRKETWANMVRLINVRIEAMPTGTRPQQRRKQELATVSAHLNAVRIAQRNDVMHPKATYTRAQAHEVFHATRQFVTYFAGLL